MATLNLTGAESGSATGEAGVLVFGTAAIQSTTKRTGGYAFQANPTGAGTGYAAVWNATGIPLNLTTIYIRFYFRYATKPASGSELICRQNQQVTLGTLPSVGAKCDLRLNSDGKLATYNAALALVATGTTVLSADTWYRIELKVVKGTSGSYELKIDGNVELSGTVNTDSDSASNIAQVYFGKSINFSSQTVDFYFDDIRISDSAYPGEGEIKVMVPDGDGLYTDWANNWDECEELPPDDDTTFASTSTNLQRETFTLVSAATAGISGTINCVKSNVVARRTTQLVNARVITRIPSTSWDDDPLVALETAYAAYGKAHDTRFDFEGAWTTTVLDELQVGMQHTQSQAREARMTAAYVMVDFTPAVSGYTIAAASGSYSLTGTAATLKANRILGAAGGTYSLTGTVVGTLYGRKLAAEAGAYSLVGDDISFLRSFVLGAASGVYGVTGEDAALLLTRLLDAEAGSYVLAGSDVGLVRGYGLAAEGGVYVLSGTAAGLLVARTLPAESGVYLVTGSDVGLAKGITLIAESGTYLLTGTDAALLLDRALNAESGAYVLTGQNAALIYSALGGYTLVAESGTYVLTGDIAGLLAGRVVPAESGVYAITGAQAELLAQRVLQADAGAYAIVGSDAGLLKDYRIEAAPGVYQLTGQDIVFGRTYVLDAESGLYVLAGTPALVVYSGEEVAGVYIPTFRRRRR